MEVKKENIGKADSVFSHTRLFYIPHLLELLKEQRTLKTLKLNQLEVRTSNFLN